MSLFSKVEAPEWAISAETADTGGAFLKCLKDNTVVEIIPLDKKSYYVFGRAEQVDVVLQHSSVSRQHAIIGHHRSGSLVLVDLNSGNGTFLGNATVPANIPAVLRESSIITFGASTRKYIVSGLDIKKNQKAQQTIQQAGPEDLEEALSAFFADINKSAVITEDMLTGSDGVIKDGADVRIDESKKDKPRKRVSFGENKVHLFSTAVDEAEQASHDKFEEKEGIVFKNAKKLEDVDIDEDGCAKIAEKSPDTVAEIFSVPERKVTIIPTNRKRKPPTQTSSTTTAIRPAKSLKMLSQMSQAADLYSSLPPVHIDSPQSTSSTIVDSINKVYSDSTSSTSVASESSTSSAAIVETKTSSSVDIQQSEAASSTSVNSEIEDIFA